MMGGGAATGAIAEPVIVERVRGEPLRAQPMRAEVTPLTAPEPVLDGGLFPDAGATAFDASMVVDASMIAAAP